MLNSYAEPRAEHLIKVTHRTTQKPPPLHSALLSCLQKPTYLQVCLALLLYQRAYQLCNSYYQQFPKAWSINKNMDNNKMIGQHLLRFIITDMMNFDYTLDGIASDIHEPIDTVIDLVSGLNDNPSFIVGMRLLLLHQQLRPELYQGLANAICGTSNQAKE